MRIKLDENLSKGAAEIFRQAGHDTESVFSQGMAGSSDQKIISVGEKDIDGKLWIIQKNRIREYQPENDIEAADQ